jgi:hypothetical protein
MSFRNFLVNINPFWIYLIGAVFIKSIKSNRNYNKQEVNGLLFMGGFAGLACFSLAFYESMSANLFIFLLAAFIAKINLSKIEKIILTEEQQNEDRDKNFYFWIVFFYYVPFSGIAVRFFSAINEKMFSSIWLFFQDIYNVVLPAISSFFEKSPTFIPQIWTISDYFIKNKFDPVGFVILAFTLIVFTFIIVKRVLDDVDDKEDMPKDAAQGFIYHAFRGFTNLPFIIILNVFCAPAFIPYTLILFLFFNFISVSQLFVIYTFTVLMCVIGSVLEYLLIKIFSNRFAVRDLYKDNISKLFRDAFTAIIVFLIYAYILYSNKNHVSEDNLLRYSDFILISFIICVQSVYFLDRSFMPWIGRKLLTVTTGSIKKYLPYIQNHKLFIRDLEDKGYITEDHLIRTMNVFKYGRALSNDDVHDTFLKKYNHHLLVVKCVLYFFQFLIFMTIVYMFRDYIFSHFNELKYVQIVVLLLFQPIFGKVLMSFLCKKIFPIY